MEGWREWKEYWERGEGRREVKSCREWGEKVGEIVGEDVGEKMVRESVEKEVEQWKCGSRRNWGINSNCFRVRA